MNAMLSETRGKMHGASFPSTSLRVTQSPATLLGCYFSTDKGSLSAKRIYLHRCQHFDQQHLFDFADPSSAALLSEMFVPAPIVA
jgi:hypothetical protein